MPSQSGVVIDDGQLPTPVSHTFAPNGAMRQADGKTVGEWVDRSGGITAGYWKITEQYMPINQNGMGKIRFVIDRVTLETLSNNTSTGINPSPVKAYSTIATMEFFLHERSSLSERRDILALLKNFLASTFVKTSVENFENVW